LGFDVLHVPRHAPLALGLEGSNAEECVSGTESPPEGQARDSTASTAELSGSDHGETLALRPGDTIGRYQVLGLLGAGGMGHVYAALDPELGRTVALKLIRADGRAPSARSRARLLREAQALARLQHRNVVTLHDVGTHGDEVFLTMELIAGRTLAAWLGSSARPWREILDVFAAAGLGLAAAHAVGIIHRDFKPSNVVVGADRVVVVDFGLACARADEADREEAEGSGSGTLLHVDLTLTGERVGTPRYMAPEQHVGGRVTALADQFAFAASLWEALFGVPPFNGETRAEVVQSMTRPPADRQVPERVRAALARALALRPSERWPTLAALLAELTRDPAAARRRFLAILAVSVAAIAAPVAFVAGRQTPAPSCAAPATGLWDDATRAGVRSAFLATGKAYAAGSFERVDAILGARAAAWEDARAEACAATEIRHEQSAALMDARMACLARAREQITAFVDLLRSADAPAMERATAAAAHIGDLDACTDVATLTAVLPPPPDPESVSAIDRIQPEIAHLEALVLLGRMKEAYAAGPALVARAGSLGYPPLHARVLYQASTAACEAGDPREAAAQLYQAARAAGAAHDDRLAVRIFIKLVYCVGAKDQNLPAAQALVEAAEAALARAGAPPDLRIRLYREQYRLRRHAGDLAGAFGFAALALMNAQRLYGEESAEAGPSLGDLGDILSILGAYRAALEVYGRALPVLERTRGPFHPGTATYLSNMGVAAAEAGDLAVAADTFARALAIEELNGPEQAGVPFILRNLATARERQGRLDAARQLVLRARAIDEKTRRPDHPAFALDMQLLSSLAVDRGDLGEAEALAHQALAIFRATYGAEDAHVADVHVLLSQIARKRRDLRGARRLIEHALAVHRKALGRRHPTVASDQSVLAAIFLEAGQARAAVPLLEEALAIHEAARNDDAVDVLIARTLLAEAMVATGDFRRAIALAERAVATAGAGPQRADLEGRARFALAQALATADRPRARKLAREARALLRGSPAADDVVRVDRWLAGRGGTPG